MKRLPIVLVLILAATAAAAGAQTFWTLEDAMSRGPAARPEYAAAVETLRAAQAARDQAGAWPNPAAFLRLEAAPRDGDAWRGAERIAGLSQTLPLGGRVGAARRAGEAAVTTREYETVALLRAMEAEIQGAFAAAVRAQETLALRHEAVLIARRLEEAVARRVEMGDAPVVDLRRARAERGAAEAAAAGAVAADAEARAALAAAPGDAGRAVDGVIGDAAGDPLPGGLEDLVAGLNGSPLIRAAESRAVSSEARARAVSRARIPDLEIEAGLRESSSESSFDLGFRVDLPLFDRGGAGLDAVRAEALAAAAQARAARLALEARLRGAHAAMTAARQGADIYAETVIPETLAALRSAEAAYAVGETSLTEVLLARRDWLEARLTHIDLVRDAHTARAELHAIL